jgi:hypothetical protein
MKIKIPCVVFYFFMGVILASQSGCQNKGSYRLHLEFPDEESKTFVSRIHVSVLWPSGHVCDELISGNLDPKSIAALPEVELKYPSDASGLSGIEGVPAGNLLFYAEGLNENGGTLLKGCSPARVEGGQTIDVTVKMAWSCRPVSEEEIPQNGVDDNCDGRTDECLEDMDCKDLNRCTMDFCSEEACHHSVYPDLGTPIQCDDGKLCTLGDTCAEGICVGMPKDCSSFGGICLDGICDPATGTCVQKPSTDGTGCDDGKYCTVNDACANGECAGSPRVCTSADPCLMGACNEGAKECEFALNPIPGAEGSAGTCDDGKDNDCDGLTDMSDPNCKPCQNTSECNDGNVCTTDECTVEGCRNDAVQDGTECDDGKYCTAGDQCAGGVCTPEGPRSCAGEEDACHFGVCDEEADQCVKQQKTNGTSCEDGFSCTAVEQCAEGVCQVVAMRDCSDSNDCTLDTCQEVLGCQHQNQPKATPEGQPGDASCDNGIDDDCDMLTDYEEDPDCRICLPGDSCGDNNPCTDDSCTQGLCLHQNKGEGTSCEDGYYCIASKTCTGGICSGVPRSCEDDGNPCTDDLCDSQANQCVYPWHAQPGVKEICFDGIDQDCDHVTDGCCLGNGAFAAKVDYPTGIGPFGVTASDFNADSILDLVVANNDLNTISVLLGNGSSGRGDGTFAAKVDYPTGTDPISVTAGDFNFDGILDLAVTNRGSSTVSVFLGNGSSGRGDGTFVAKVDYPTGVNPWSVTTGDFNADSILDLAVANINSANVSVLLGNGSTGRGDGTFATKVDYPTGSSPVMVATGDFNTDSILDLVVANADGSNVSVLMGNGSSGRGDGTFAPKVDYPTGTYPQSVATGDFNADSILDLVVTNANGSNVSVFLGNGSSGRGNGTFAPKVDYPTGARPLFVTTGDFNFDGILDLAVVNYDSSRVSVLLGNGSGGCGDGTFAPKVDYLAGTNPRTAVAGDLNADSILDLAVTNAGSNNVSVLLGTGSGSRGNGTFAARLDYPTGTEPNSVTVADFNADGMMDLAVANEGSNNVSVLLGRGSAGKGDGTFAPKVDYASGSRSWFLTTGDFNADSILDLAVVNWGSDNISVLLGRGSGGRGNGTFAWMVNYTTGGNPRSVATGDFNADAILDLVVTNSWSNNVSVLLGNGSSGRGNGTFAAKVDYPIGSYPYSVTTGDFNADAILDLAVANSGDPPNVSVLLGNGSSGRGDGTFAPKVDYLAGSGPDSVVAGDFNADSILDLAVANWASDNVSVLLGNGSGGRGDGTFATRVNYPTGKYSRTVTMGDFNADGILDLAVANFWYSQISVLLGNGSSGRGNGTFAPKVDYGFGVNPWPVAAGDFNSDGILDLVTANYNANSVSVRLGRGTCLSQ